MNIQFEKLAEQAGFNIHNDTIDGHNFNHEIEKFAQLIVRECADIATMNQHQWASAGSYVLEHFGIEQRIENNSS